MRRYRSCARGVIGGAATRARRGETLLKGATHNLIVRSRSDVAIYVLNHKRAHLRMLEEPLQDIDRGDRRSDADRTPSFAIDRGEQVMSMDQAKAIAATIKPDSISAYGEDEDIEVVEVMMFSTNCETEGEETAEGRSNRNEAGGTPPQAAALVGAAAGATARAATPRNFRCAIRKAMSGAAAKPYPLDGEASAEDATSSADGDSEKRQAPPPAWARGGRHANRRGPPERVNRVTLTGDEASGEWQMLATK